MAYLLSYLASRSYLTLRRRRQSGQALVEYAIILILVSVVCVVVLVTEGSQLQNLFSNITCGFGHCSAPEPQATPTPYCNGVCHD